MEDLAKLQIRVQSLEVGVANKRLKRLERQGGKTERATDGLTSSFKRLAGPVALAAGAVAGLTKLVSVTRQFDVLNAQLITATGNSENAAVAFEAIQDFAANTPYDLQQVTEGFTKLVNLGLTPSERALTSYGDTASAMGKDLNQLIEAVADAATGEFERLKEFGIKSKSEGDNVSFTFRGVTTTVKKNAEEIEGYLLALGENNFAGAMANRMDTLDGAISNLGDEWNKLWLNLSNQGVGDVIEDGVRVAIDIIGDLNDLLSSGELEGYLDAIAGKFTGFGEDAERAINAIVDLWEDAFGGDAAGGIGAATTETIDFITNALQDLPENVRAMVQAMAVEFAAFTQYGSIHGEAYGELLAIEFNRIVDKAGVFAEGIAAALNPFDEGDFDLGGALEAVDRASDQLATNVDARVEQRITANARLRKGSLQDIFDERQAALSSFDAQIKAAEELGKAHAKAKENKSTQTGDRLERFSLATEKGEGDDAPDKAALRAQAAREKSFDGLVESLRTEEEVIQESYTRRLAIILDNTAEGSEQQANLKARLDEEFATDALGSLGQPDTYEEEMEALEEFYNARRELILENVGLTEEQRTELELELAEERNSRLAQLELARNTMLLQQGQAMFSGLAGLAKTFGGEQSSAYKKLFAASQAFGIATATMNMYTGISEGVKLGWPAMIPAIALATLEGTAAISGITSQNFSGAFDNGGYIPRGNFGIVGELGPELVQGPVNVTSRKDTAKLFNPAPGSSSGSSEAIVVPAPIVNVIIDPNDMLAVMASGAGEEQTITAIESNASRIKSILSI